MENIVIDPLFENLGVNVDQVLVFDTITVPGDTMVEDSAPVFSGVSVNVDQAGAVETKVAPDDNHTVADATENDHANLVATLTISDMLQDATLADDAVISVLVDLAQLQVTYPALKETGAGKVVWTLKERQGKVCMLAARLVTRWKRMMSQYKPGDSVDIVDEMAIDMHQYDTVSDHLNLLRQERPVTQ